MVARDEAERRGHTWIGTEHVLLALASDPNGLAARLLDIHHVRAAVQEELRAMLDSESYAGGGSNTVRDPDAGVIGRLVKDGEGTIRIERIQDESTGE